MWSRGLVVLSQSRSLVVLWSCCLSLVLLWFRLVDHLRIEWAVNPQYGYGFAVPFLCIYLLSRAMPYHRTTGLSQLPGPGPVVLLSRGPVVPSGLVVLFSLLYAPTRLIQEANPEWRLVSWALALEVVAITLVLLRYLTEHRLEK